jgi:hypothetical protein
LKKNRITPLKESLLDRIKWDKTMIRLIAVAAFALGLATAVQAMPVAPPVAPLHQPNGMYTQARVHHGVARRHVRRSVRRVRDGVEAFALGGTKRPPNRAGEEQRAFKRS